MTDPINNEDHDFARAVVALARKHGLSSINLEYRYGFRSKDNRHDTVRITWAEGRHGAKAQIDFHAQAFVSISEKEDLVP